MYLHEALAAYRATLQERTRERVPLDWATTQFNLGLALQTLGERESDSKSLEEVLTAYRAALTVYETGDDSFRAEVARRCIAQSEAALERGRKN